MMPAQTRALLALLLLIPVPSLGIWTALVGAPGPVGKAVFALSKAWFFLLPVVWLVTVDRERPSFPRPSARGMNVALLSGGFIAAVIVAAWWWIGRQWIDVGLARETAAAAGLGDPKHYVVAALYWCTANSLLEEYAWRWFVTTRFESLLPRLAAVFASAAAFSLHHAVALGAYFDFRVTALATLGVFIGGATWSWIYVRYRNIWVAYVSHVLADVAVFGVGWVLLFG